ncbi:NB-ARC domain-containing protein [Marinobacter sp.]|uniref:NB-ARC domain-containing protein n=1 Tax=Marinobacter sp. TaxID=50741 RepID=UPI0034A479FC
MAIRNFATRMSCFSLVSSIETDLRNFIFNELPDDRFDILPDDVVENARQRYFDHKKEAYSKEGTLNELLEFLDFYDLSKVLHKLKPIQSQFSNEDILYICQNLENLTKCRNRVCHSRPLEPNDLNDLLDFVYELNKRGGGMLWKNINEARKNLDNPAFALSLNIPNFWKESKKTISHNLPLPEFDDTGFMGREKDRKSINKLLTSNTKVISIVGEGGVGKTALAQRCLYDILEICEDVSVNEPVFEIIVWVTLKANRLTVKGIEQIKSAVDTGAGLFHEVSKNLSGLDPSNAKTALAEISEYMSEFRILLCIDNLETISSEEVRDFLADVPADSKVLITTRIGLGEIEYRYKLDNLDDKHAIELMRTMSKLLNLDSLYKKKNDILKNLCVRLYNNPLLIKWYVLAVAGGKSPSDLIDKKNVSFTDALRFCFENLYDRLGSVESKVISIVACMRRPVSAVELRFFLGETPEIEVEEALHQLNNSSMLVSTGDRLERQERLYNLTGVAEEYINSIRPVKDDIYQLVKAKRKELQKILDQHSIIRNHYKYDVNAISWKTRDEKICSIYLKKALIEAKKGNFEGSESLVDTAKKMMPEFSECYRIHGMILKEQNPFKAGSQYDTAVDLAPHSAISHYSYAQFLIAEEDFDRALEQINEAVEIDSDDNALKTCKAWILTLSGDYKDASVLYEELIPNQKGQLRKFRISTFDQASTCYRRMGELYSRDNDLEEARKCFQRAGSILVNSIKEEDFDHGTVSKLVSLFGPLDALGKKSNDFSLIFSIIDSIKDNIKRFNVGSLQAIDSSVARNIEAFDDSVKQKIISLKEEIRFAWTPEGADRILGTVSRIVEKTKGVSFGFISGIDEVEYFFHRGELHPPNILDEEFKRNVTFKPSENDRGPFAEEIRLADK